MGDIGLSKSRKKSEKGVEGGEIFAPAGVGGSAVDGSWVGCSF